jgi:hypothetical protein
MSPLVFVLPVIVACETPNRRHAERATPVARGESAYEHLDVPLIIELPLVPL